MFERIEYYLNPINLIKGIVNFFLRRDILQILVLYSLAKYIWINGFFKEYLSEYLISFSEVQHFVYDTIGFNVNSNAFFILALAILAESYRDKFPSSLAHIIVEIISPLLVFISLWTLSTNIFFAAIIGILQHIAGKGTHLTFLEANDVPLHQF